MDIGECGCELVKKREKLLNGEPFSSSQQVCNSLAFNQLHRYEEQSLMLADVVNLDHVGMCQTAGNDHFLTEFVAQPRIARDERQDNLDGDRLVGQKISRLVERAHASGTELGKD